jgi:hypothetical protein
MGVKLICPNCGKVYFGWIRSGFDFWNNKKDAFNDEVCYGGKSFVNEEKGKFVKKYIDSKGNECFTDLGYYQIDLSYYETFNDEGEGIDSKTPSYLCTEDDERTRWYQTRKN